MPNTAMVPDPEMAQQELADSGQVPVADQSTPALVFSQGTYEMLRAMVEVILPGVGAFYTALAGVWGFGYVAQVVGTIAAVITLLGVIIRLSRRTYNKSDAKYDGVIHVHETSDGLKQANLILSNYANPADVVNQKEVLFKVKGT